MTPLQNIITTMTLNLVAINVAADELSRLCKKQNKNAVEILQLMKQRNKVNMLLGTFATYTDCFIKEFEKTFQTDDFN